MADEHNSPNRVNPPSDRATQGATQNDPLAELARLIGQNDPFSEFGRNVRNPAPQTAPAPAPIEQPLVPPPYTQARDQFAASPYQQPQEPPAFIQAAHDSGAYRTAVFHEAGQLPPGSDHYDEMEERGRGRSFRTIGAVIALALIGTVAAFGYRIIFSGPSSSAPPPVIRANPDPAKVPPPAAGAEAQSKSTYDRVGERAQGERVVVREEAPADLKEVARPGAGRSPPQQQGPAGQWSSTPAPPGGATAPSAMGEPKKVRTVTIRPNSTDNNAAPPSLTPPAAAVAPPAPPARQAPIQQQQQRVQQPQVPQPQVQQQQVQQQAQQRPPAVAPVQSSPPPANAPLSLNEDSVLSLPRSLNEPRASPPPRQAPVQRQTPQQNTAVAAAPPPPQPLAQAPAKGGYLVQISSQRSEAEAQASLRSIQARYPNVLGGQPATIRRAELGERGVFYRAMVGPYANREQASQVCSSLKAAGGDCIVQGN